MAVTAEDVRTALATVKDPEIRRPITDLGHGRRRLTVDAGGVVDADRPADHRRLSRCATP